METRKISELKNWDKNPRSIKEKDFERLKKQITELGQYKPLLITEDGTVLGGNMRLRAYKALGIDDIWVSVVDAPTEEKKLEYALSDNDRAGFYDSDLLANMIPDFPDFEWADYAVDLKEPQSLQDLIDKFTPVEEDEVPEVPTEAISKLGEVYQLGRHRLMCGDAIKIEDVEKLMNGQKADMVFTDPPYGVAYTGGQFYSGKPSPNRREEIIGDRNLIYQESISNAVAYSKGGAFYIFYGSGFSAEVLTQLKNAGLEQRAIIIWKKLNTGYGDLNSNYKNNYEPMFYGVIKGKGANWNGDTTQTTTWEFDKPKHNELHPTMKPIELIVKALNNSSKQDDIVLDLFGGSGSTLIACEQTNRTCYMMELDPKYCDVIRTRYQNFIDKQK